MRTAVLDGELVCLGDDGRSLFQRLLFRRDWPFFFAFDLLEVDGVDLRDQPLIVRKRRLRQILPRARFPPPLRRLSGGSGVRAVSGGLCARP